MAGIVDLVRPMAAFDPETIAERISAAPYGFGTNRLSRGNSLLFGGANPVTTIKWIGGHLSLIAAASRSPSIEPGMSISVMTSWISRLQRLNSLVGVERCNDPVPAAFQNCTQILAN